MHGAFGGGWTVWVSKPDRSTPRRYCAHEIRQWSRGSGCFFLGGGEGGFKGGLRVRLLVAAYDRIVPTRRCCAHIDTQGQRRGFDDELRQMARGCVFVCV